MTKLPPRINKEKGKRRRLVVRFASVPRPCVGRSSEPPTSIEDADEPNIAPNSDEKSLFAKASGGFVGTDEEKPSLYCNESNKLFSGQDSVDVDKTPIEGKRKKGSNKKAPKPPRPPRAPSLDAADHKLIRELTELAMLKRARIERLKALRNMRASKSSSSSSSRSILATFFTIFFCIVIIFQGTMAQLFDVEQEECSVILFWTYGAAVIALTLWSTLLIWSTVKIIVKCKNSNPS